MVIPMLTSGYLNRKALQCTALISAVALVGCKSPNDGLERGPGGTIAYEVLIESEEPGARIEVDGEYVGKTPIKVKVFGDKDGTFHNFHDRNWIVNAYAVHPGGVVQTKEYRTGVWFQGEDKVPSHIFFSAPPTDNVRSKESPSIARVRPRPLQPQPRASAVITDYAGIGEGHWIEKNIGDGEYIKLEDGSLWEVDPFDKVDAALWLSLSEITVLESSDGSPGYDFVLVNTDDSEKAHAKLVVKP